VNILLFKVYIILAKPESAGSAGIPCVYALFPNKEMVTYLKLFSIIKEHLEDCSKLSKFISDFEKAVFGAVYWCYQTLIRGGCRFHLTLQFGRRLVIKGFKVFFLPESKFPRSILHALRTVLRSCRQSQNFLLNYY